MSSMIDELFNVPKTRSTSNKKESSEPGHKRTRSKMNSGQLRVEIEELEDMFNKLR